MALRPAACNARTLALAAALPDKKRVRPLALILHGQAIGRALARSLRPLSTIPMAESSPAGKPHSASARAAARSQARSGSSDRSSDQAGEAKARPAAKTPATRKNRFTAAGSRLAPGWGAPISALRT